VVLAETDEIGVAEFPQVAAQVPGFESFAVPALPPARTAATKLAAEPLVLLDDAPATVPEPAAAGDALPLLGADGHVRPMETLEAEAIRFAINRYRGRMSEVARRLRIGRSTLYRKLKDLGIDTGAEESAEADASVARE